MKVEWDGEKAASNLKKHGIGFADAATVLFDDLAVTIRDDSVDEEERFVTLGMDALGSTSRDRIYVAGRGRKAHFGAGGDAA